MVGKLMLSKRMHGLADHQIGSLYFPICGELTVTLNLRIYPCKHVHAYSMTCPLCPSC